ncbi:MAG: orotidine-5'-phosphate decarboxylase [Acidobacteriia bacterium]|nr:orotidine-5'-phosphate decarboxylase [Terriglobia bacterium]
MEKARQKLIVALDFPSLEPAFELAQSLAHLVCMFKINIYLFTAAGPAAVEKLRQLGSEIFLDLKFHDIPNTVSGAVSSAFSLPGVRLLNIHALGGLDMMRAAANVRDTSKLPGPQRPKVLGVTILTSMDNAALKNVGIAGPPAKRVVSLAKLAKKAGLDGVVASPEEARAIRRACGKDFLIVVPGVRPSVEGGSGRASKRLKDDQARYATPAKAIRDGADFLVVGRPITAAPDPVAAAQAILDEIASALP